jgi:hypothetical protein
MIKVPTKMSKKVVGMIFRVPKTKKLVRTFLSSLLIELIQSWCPTRTHIDDAMMIHSKNTPSKKGFYLKCTASTSSFRDRPAWYTLG